MSITAISGSLVGTLTTMTKNPGETFVYELVDEAQLPFSIIGDRLVVAKKDGLDFYVSSAEEALIPIAIISKGNMSAPVRKSFYVRIIGEIMNIYFWETVFCVQPAGLLLIKIFRNSIKEAQNGFVDWNQIFFDGSLFPHFNFLSLELVFKQCAIISQ